jgi:hypothetical protein
VISASIQTPSAQTAVFLNSSKASKTMSKVSGVKPPELWTQIFKTAQAQSLDV